MKRLFILLALFNSLSPIFAQWQNIFLNDAGGFYYASSELEKPANPMDIGRYTPKNLIDQDYETAWVEGEKGPGSGTFVYLGMATTLKKNIIIYNGYQQSENLFKKNNRVKDLRLTYYIGFYNKGKEGQFGLDLIAASYQDTAIITLKDKMGAQVIAFPFELKKIKAFNEKEKKKYLINYKNTSEDNGAGDSPGEVLIVKFEILSVYKGSTWDDTCIAEIEFSNRSIGEFLPLNESVTDVFQDVKSGNIIMKTSGNKTLLLADAQKIAKEHDYSGEGEFLTLDIMDVDPNYSWAIIDYQHGFTGGGHIEETYKLWSLKKMEAVPESLLQTYGITPSDAMLFATKNNRLYLDTSEGKKILLDDLQQDMEQLSRY